MDKALYTQTTNETNPANSEMVARAASAVRTISWTSKELARVERLRLVSDRGFPAWDVSYCSGVTHSGEVVEVSLPFGQLPKRDYKATILAHAKRERVYAKGLGVFEAISTCQ